MFLALRSTLRGQCEVFTERGRQVAAQLEDRKDVFAASWPRQLGRQKRNCDYK